MRFTRNALLAAVALFMSASQANAQNLAVNPGFEDPITSDGAPFVGFWEGFNGAGASSIRDTVQPRTGLGHLHMNITATNDSFAGAFQDIEGLTPGQIVTYSGWHMTPISRVFDLVPEVRIEWRKTGQGPEVDRDQILPVPTADYTQFSLALPVPLGADTARIVYAIQTGTNAGTLNTGSVYVDDVSLTVIPEPTTLALASLAGAALLVARRRRG